MKKEAKLLSERAPNSLNLSIEHFNRPFDQGRIEAVLVMLDHPFEMLLKAAIIERGGRIRDPKAKQTISFDKCIRIGLTGGSVKFLSEDQALALQAVNGLRDAAQHHIVDLSEGHLYVLAQAFVTLFRDILMDVFAMALHDCLPDRVLAISTRDCLRQVRVRGKVESKAYSPKALQKLREELPHLDVDQIWRRRKSRKAPERS